jgi:hypothetical protein
MQFRPKIGRSAVKTCFPLFYPLYFCMQKSDNRSPEKKHKRPAWSRHLDVVLRTAHVAVTSVVFGGAVFAAPRDQLLSWYYLTVATGLGLIASEIYHSYHWPYQGRGAMVLIHMGVLGIIHLRPDLTTPVLAVALIFGMVGSHMPKRFRYWSFAHGRIMD